MDTTLLHTSLAVQDTFLQRIQSIISSFGTSIEIKIREKKSIHVSENSSRKNNYILQIELINKLNYKTIYFSFYDGYSGDKNLCYDRG